MSDNYRFTKAEKKIRSLMKKMSLSPSHDFYHIDRVIGFASVLQASHGGDIEIIRISALLHDLGRNDPEKHGDESIRYSISQATELLAKTKLSETKQNEILIAIEDHDKPNFQPRSMEGKILKEADFLAGFGAWGILRIAMWAAETTNKQENAVDQIIDRLDNRMPSRFSSLEFPESKSWATKEITFAKVFSALLNQAPEEYSHNTYPGKYIILEGNSGTGKNTQASMLRDRIEEHGGEVEIVIEPTENYANVRDFFIERGEDKLEDPFFRRFLFIADRYKQIREKIIPALKQGKIIISARSFISTLVYQSETEFDIALTAYIQQQFVPDPSFVILYDVDTKIAFQRITDREKEKSRHENPRDLQKHRAMYKSIFEAGYVGPNYAVIDATGTKSEVLESTWKKLKHLF